MDGSCILFINLSNFYWTIVFGLYIHLKAHDSNHKSDFTTKLYFPFPTVTPIIEPINDISIHSEEQLLVSCIATGIPTPTFQWLKGQDVIISAPRISFPAPHILVINNLSNDDQGRLKCLSVFICLFVCFCTFLLPWDHICS